MSATLPAQTMTTERTSSYSKANSSDHRRGNDRGRDRERDDD